MGILSGWMYGLVSRLANSIESRRNRQFKEILRLSNIQIRRGILADKKYSPQPSGIVSLSSSCATGQLFLRKSLRLSLAAMTIHWGGNLHTATKLRNITDDPLQIRI